MTPNRQKRTRIQMENEERVLTAATQVFANFGYRGSTVDQIAEACEMSKANVLYYFRTKEEIYLAVLQIILSDWLDPLQDLDPNGDAITEIVKYAKAKLMLSKTQPIASRLFANEILQGAPMIKDYLHNELKALVDDKCAILLKYMDDGSLKRFEPIHLIFMIWSTTQHYADFEPQISALHDGTADELYGDAWQFLETLLVDGLKPRA